MTARHIAWINLVSAIGITLVVPLAVESYGFSRVAYLFIALAWIGTLTVFPILLRVDRRRRGVAGES